MTYKDLEKYLKENNISKMDFCRETGISPQTITNAKSRGGHFSGATMNKMEIYFLHKKSAENEKKLFNLLENHVCTDEEMELINDFRELDEESKRQLVLMIAFLKEQNNKNK